MTMTRGLAWLLLLGGCTIITEENASEYETTLPVGSTPPGDPINPPGPLTSGDRYHPVGYSDPVIHGPPTLLLEEDCTECHGPELRGGTSGVDCDACHEVKDWRENCTYCHGGEEGDETGAPPRDITGEVDPDLIPFPPHRSHTTLTDSPAYPCVACHEERSNVLDVGHLFVGDTTPGEAEVNLAGSHSPAGQYNGQGCGNVYCHGNGRVNGSMELGAPSPGCDDCHAGAPSGDWSSMSGEHSRHMRSGVACSDCHEATVAGGKIINPTLHVNGTVNLQFVGGFNGSANSCNGLCHGQLHFFNGW